MVRNEFVGLSGIFLKNTTYKRKKVMYVPMDTLR